MRRMKKVNKGIVLVWIMFVYHTNGQTLQNTLQFKLGTFPPDDKVAKMTPIQSFLRENDSIPSSFDARIKWPGYIHPPEDQGNCNGSWAFSTAGVAADRVAIESNGTYIGYLSAQHILSCAQGEGKDGCSGGYLDRAWQFIKHNRILASSCYEGNLRVPCLRDSKKLYDLCDQKEFLVYIRMTPPYRIGNTEEDIMIEIMYNGPVQTMIKVSEDFFRYQSGIYRYSTSIRLGELNHSVRIIGWGEERLQNGEILKYWLCVNSWGQKWGENGYFKIERGGFEKFPFTLSAHFSYFELAGSEWRVNDIEGLGAECARILQKFLRKETKVKWYLEITFCLSKFDLYDALNIKNRKTIKKKKKKKRLKFLH